MKNLLKVLIAVTALWAVADSVYAYRIDAALGDSYAIFGEYGGAGGNTIGMTDWYVGGVDYAFTQWFAYKKGDDPVMYLDELATPTVEFTSSSLGFVYETADLSISVSFSIAQAGGGTAVIGEEISLINTTDEMVRFYQFSDFDLSADLGNSDSISYAVSGTPPASGVHQSGDDTSLRFHEAVVAGTSAQPDAYAIGTYDEVYDEFYDDNWVFDDGTADSLEGTTVDANVAWAFRWDVLSGGGVTISKQKFLGPVPEPSSFALMLIGICGLSAYRKRKHA